MKKLNIGIIIYNIIFLIIGIWLIINDSINVDIIKLLLGTIIIVDSISLIMIELNKEKSKLISINTIASFIGIIIGSIIAIDVIDYQELFLFGLITWLTILGLIRLKKGLENKKQKKEYWILIFLLSIIQIFLGIIILILIINNSLIFNNTIGIIIAASAAIEITHNIIIMKEEK